MKALLATLISIAATVAVTASGANTDSSPLVVMDPFETTIMRADEVDQQAVVLDRIQPRYPHECALRGLMGRVEIVAVVRADGGVEEARVIRADNSEFAAAALSAVRKWTFEPARKDGHPVAVRVSIPVRFVVPELLAGK